MDWPTCRALDTAALGRLGEEEAARFLQCRGIVLVGRNVVVDTGEIDILARIDGQRTLVEVRSVRLSPQVRWPPPHPLSAFDWEKARQTKKVARTARCSRVDLISVSFHPGGVDLHWIPKVV